MRYLRSLLSNLSQISYGGAETDILISRVWTLLNGLTGSGRPRRNGSTLRNVEMQRQSLRLTYTFNAAMAQHCEFGMERQSHRHTYIFHAAKAQRWETLKCNDKASGSLTHLPLQWLNIVKFEMERQSLRLTYTYHAARLNIRNC